MPSKWRLDHQQARMYKGRMSVISAWQQPLYQTIQCFSLMTCLYPHTHRRTCGPTTCRPASTGTAAALTWWWRRTSSATSPATCRWVCCWSLRTALQGDVWVAVAGSISRSPRCNCSARKTGGDWAELYGWGLPARSQGVGGRLLGLCVIRGETGKASGSCQENTAC